MVLLASPPLCCPEDIPTVIADMEQYFAWKHNGWMKQFQERKNMFDLGVEIAAPKPKKKRTKQYNDEEGWGGSANDDNKLQVRVRVSSTGLLIDELRNLKWDLPEYVGEAFFDFNQNGETSCILCVSNVTRDVEIRGLEMTFGYFIKQSFASLSKKGVLTTEEMAKRVPRHYIPWF